MFIGFGFPRKNSSCRSGKLAKNIRLVFFTRRSYRSSIAIIARAIGMPRLGRSKLQSCSC